MPLFIKIDFRSDNGKLAAWFTTDDSLYGQWSGSSISETTIRDVLISLADQIDPEKDSEDAEIYIT